ncbi:MAG: endonuclease III domain-containing protein, partial [Planctomycetota bacterium JB042]
MTAARKRRPAAVRDAAARVGPILEALHEEYPDADCELRYRNALELLAATILSAQCTDARVNEVTKGLFRNYRSAAAYADAPPGVLEEEIRSTGFFNNKAKSLRGMGAALRDRFGGKVPRTMDELLSVPGVARKTANVVLGTAYGIPSGMVVDTHVLRLAGR